MAFDLYFAGIQALELDQYLSSKNCHRLFSFADMSKKRLELYNHCTSNLFIDSGAFGVAHSDKEVTLDEYIDFINNTPRGTLFAALDVIPVEKTTSNTILTAQQSWDNYCYMLEHVKPEYKHKIVPSYHYAEPYEALERMLNGYNGYVPPYIAFGGRVGTPTKHLHPSLDKFFDIIKQVKPDTKVHGFGITVPHILQEYPFTSADSTSWLKTAITGSLFFECTNGATVNISERTTKDKSHFIYKDSHTQKSILEEIEKYGYDYEDMTKNFRPRLRFNVDYWLRWQQNYKYEPRVKVKKRTLF